MNLKSRRMDTGPLSIAVLLLALGSMPAAGLAQSAAASDAARGNTITGGAEAAPTSDAAVRASGTPSSGSSAGGASGSGASDTQSGGSEIKSNKMTGGSDSAPSSSSSPSPGGAIWKFGWQQFGRHRVGDGFGPCEGGGEYFGRGVGVEHGWKHGKRGGQHGRKRCTRFKPRQRDWAAGDEVKRQAGPAYGDAVIR
jgi:hypothetical protein